MNKISESLKDIVSENAFLQFGLSEGLFNLSKLSKFLNPLVAARTKKEVTDSAVLMQLSRMKRKSFDAPSQDAALRNRKTSPELDSPFYLEKLTVHSSLCAVTFSNTKENRKHLYEFRKRLAKDGAFVVVTQGVFQIIIIFPEVSFQSLIDSIDDPPEYTEKNVSCLVTSFAIEQLDVPGLMYSILQKLYLQNISLVELASTTTELSVFLKEKDMRLAFDTLYNSFLVKR